MHARTHVNSRLKSESGISICIHDVNCLYQTATLNVGKFSKIQENSVIWKFNNIQYLNFQILKQTY